MVSAALPAGAFEGNAVERCTGYGDLQSLDYQGWESGLGSWMVSRQEVANPATFDTPDWATIGDLPDTRPGSAAFVANLDEGNCTDDDETGVLRLLSPSIVIPPGAEVPRISFEHWFQIEEGWDGGNLRISVNGAGFNLVPASAIELGPYSGSLFPELDTIGDSLNTNPLADQPAYTGTIDGQPTGRWIQSRINLLGIAEAGDSIRLRFDYGVDCAGGDIGWYVDDVEFYYCPFELPPSNCGNGVVNGPEQCDDGNDHVGDGCSNTCQVESGWQCASPTSDGDIDDPSFEAGRVETFWAQESNNFLGSPVCDIATCGAGGGSGPSDGTYWAFFGGVLPTQEASVSQTIEIAETARKLTFDLQIPGCDSADDFVEVLIDGVPVFEATGASPLCGKKVYSRQTANISAFADGGLHTLEFHSQTVATNGGVTNFFVDDVALPGDPSICRPDGTSLILVKEVFNDDGGSDYPSAWTLAASGPSVFSGPGPRVQSGAGFLPGTYDLAESGGPAGYSAGEWQCFGSTQVDGDTVQIVLDESAVCTLVNFDIAPTLTVAKTVLNNSGGTITNPNTFDLTIDGEDVSHGVANVTDFGDHFVAESPLATYQAGSWGGDCQPDGSISLALGQNATCSIVNDDIPATLTLIKHIVSDNGGTVSDPDEFGLTIDGNTVSHGVANMVAAGNHLASEIGLPGYQKSVWSGDCRSDGFINLALTEDATCTLTNNDIAPTLTLVKQVINDNGGTAQPSEWTLTATGPTGFSGPGPNVSSGPGFWAGDYDLSQSDDPPGYSSGAWNCNGGNQLDGDTIRLQIGESATCTLTSNDVSPTLRVFKTIINDDEGTVTDPNAFRLRIDGVLVSHGVPVARPLGLHTVSEDQLPGYIAGPWGGDCMPDGTINLSLGQQATCTITNNDIDAISLTLVKEVINDDGGTAAATGWILSASGPSSFIGSGPEVSNNPGLLPGTYTLSEAGGHAGYAASDWSCTGGTQIDGDTIDLVPGDVATCTITNNDIRPTLTIDKTIVNDNFGTILDPDAFGLRISGNPVSNNVPVPLDAGEYTVSEVGLPGYTAGPWGGDCAADGSILLAPGDAATCTITNDDDDSPSLTLYKEVFNDDGGEAEPADWTLAADGPTAFSGPGPVVPSPANFQPGIYDLSETGGPSGYSAGNWVCSNGNNQIDGDTVQLAAGDDVSCTIINNDITPHLIVNKNIINDDGGTLFDPNAFDLRVDDQPVQHGVANPFAPGNHLVSELEVAGYEPGGWGGDCNPDGSIDLSVGQVATCTITNDDIPATLTVIKEIINDSNGEIQDPNAFTLRIDGNIVLHGAPNLVDAGNHTVSEDGVSGYTPSAWGGDCAPDGSITLEPGQNATCSVTNDDVDSTSLTLVKQVVNNNGGTAQGSEWTLTATGPSATLSGFGPNVSSEADFPPGAYLLSESGGPAGYAASGWVCLGGSQTGDTITLEPGENAICTITNDDIAPTLAVDKTIVNDNGGTIEDPNAFKLRVDGAVVAHQAVNPFPAGAHVVSEDGLPGYVRGPWGGDCNADGTITLTLGQVATCTVTNDDSDATRLTLVKEVVNDDGGSAQASEWTLTADGPGGFSGNGPNVTSGTGLLPGIYDLSEQEGPSGYAASAWDCSGGSQVDGDTVDIALGQTVTCTIVNDDIAPTLTVAKTIVNDHGGSVTDPDAFGLRIDGELVDHEAVNVLSAGNHSVSEDGLPGYEPGDWGGACQADGSITLVPGQTASCTIINVDVASGLTLMIDVTNDDGGTAGASMWTLTASGPAGFSGPGPSVSGGADFEPGTYNLSVTTAPPGYSSGMWSCDGGNQTDGDTITLALGESATCEITANDIAPTLRLVKSIVNDNGGTVVSEDAFGLRIDNAGVLNNTVTRVDAGPHVASEIGQPGYAASDWGGDCAANGSITLALAETATCTITNNDIPPSLTLVKDVVNDNGGGAVPGNWTLIAQGPTGFSGAGPSVSSDAGFKAGTYNLSESGGAPGYSAGNWDCDGGDQLDGNSVAVGLGQSVTCTITNDDIPPSLTLAKAVVNDDGGSASPSAWMLSADGPTDFSGSGPLVSSGPNFAAGSYMLSESGGPTGYSASGWNCEGGDQSDGQTVALGLGESATCTITNDDIAPTLTVIKNIVNNNGGTINNPDLFALKIDGNPVSSGVANPVEPGLHTVSETERNGYLASDWGGDCSADGTVTLALGEDATCSITNNDQPPMLTLVKQVISNNGGTAQPSDWTLRAVGPTGFEGPGPSVSSGGGFMAGSYDLFLDDGAADYTAGPWSCSGGNQVDDNTIALLPGEDVSCTITSNDLAPQLTLVKEVVNDDGGAAEPSHWDLMATGPTSFSGAGPNVGSPASLDRGSYDLSESGGPAGYDASDWDCTGGSQQDGNTILLELGDSATCTITNNDTEPSLTLVKEVVNDDGGNAQPSAWTLSAAGPSPFSGPGPSVSSGAGFQAGSYDLAESGGPGGYTAGAWECTGGDQVDDDTILVGAGQAAVCTLTNSDVPPGLTLVKQVVNDDGGTAPASAWTLSADGPAGFSGPGPSVSSGDNFLAGTYDLSESDGPEGYAASTWDCVGDGQQNGNAITLESGQSATCTITNDDIAPSLTLVKEVVNDNGGTALASAWTLFAAGPAGFSGAGPSVSNGAGFEAGTYLLSETGPQGYEASGWSCQGGGQQDGNAITLAPGETASCTISNDDIAPSLTLVKQVVKDDGGTALPSAWTLFAAGPTGFNGPGPSVSSGANFKAGTYDLTESTGPDGYQASAWVCNGGTQNDGNTVTLALGDTATCTITNDDVAPGLTLIKVVRNDGGGTAVPADWTLVADGPSAFSGPGPTVSSGENFLAGTYDLSETGGPGSYTAGDWQCIGGTQVDADTITLAAGEAATCTIVNDDPGDSPVIFGDGFESLR